MLHRRGIWRVRPLAGGLEEWRRRGFPVESRIAEAEVAPEARVSLV
jgi:3-mercaptopyruvate sulfurtransferase SseA